MSLIDPNFFQRHRIALAIGGVILLLFIVGGFFAYCTNGLDKKEKEIQSNIDQQIGVNAVLANQISNQQGVVNDAANNTNQALGDLANSVNRDSSTFNGNGTNEFCRRFCDDSTCAEWRRFNECRR